MKTYIMNFIKNIKYGIYRFNTLSINETYQQIYYLCVILFFIISYTGQVLLDKPCVGIIPIGIRIFHHLVIYFIYFSFLAPSNILLFGFIISFVAIISWIIFKNKCFLTMFENRICGYPYKRVFHDLSYYVSRKFDTFLSSIRIPLVFVMVIIMMVRLYVYYRTNRIEIQGHRGSRGNRPENTISAFEFALDNGIRTLELDLHMTTDNELVIYHDDEMNQNICKKVGDIGSSLSISKMSLTDLKKYDCGSVRNDAFPQQVLSNQSIPTFVELITLIKTKYPLLSVKMNVEIKTNEGIDNNDYVKRFAKKLVDIFEQYGLVGSCIVQSFDIRALQYVKKLNPHITTSYLVENFKEDLIDAVFNICVENKFSIVSPDFENLNKSIVDKFHQQNIKVLPWTVNSIDNLKRMLDYKVDGIISDYPIIMKEYLAIT